MSESHAVESHSMPTRSKRPPKVMDHMLVMPAENGGVSVEHHFTHFEHSPETHVFGKGGGKQFAAHMMKHSGMSGSMGANDLEEAEDGGSEEAAGNEQEA